VALNPNHPSWEVMKDKMKNLQEIYQKIHPGFFLPKKSWKFTELKPDLVTCAFHSPYDGRIFRPSIGGTKLGDLHYFCDDFTAKRASFYQFLTVCADQGLIDKAFDHTTTGLYLFGRY